MASEEDLRKLEQRKREIETRAARVYGKIEEMGRNIANAEKTMRELGIPDLETAKATAERLHAKAEQFRQKASESLDEAEGKLDG